MDGMFPMQRDVTMQPPRGYQDPLLALYMALAGLQSTQRLAGLEGAGFPAGALPSPGKGGGGGGQQGSWANTIFQLLSSQFMPKLAEQYERKFQQSSSPYSRRGLWRG